MNTQAHYHCTTPHHWVSERDIVDVNRVFALWTSVWLLYARLYVCLFLRLVSWESKRSFKTAAKHSQTYIYMCKNYHHVIFKGLSFSLLRTHCSLFEKKMYTDNFSHFEMYIVCGIQSDWLEYICRLTIYFRPMLLPMIICEEKIYLKIDQ